MSHFGDLVRTLRKEKGITLEAVARKIGSHKGYVSGIENDKVNPPSIKIIKKYAKLFGQDARNLARLAWVDKAPAILKEDAEKFLKWCDKERSGSRSTAPSAKAEPHSPAPSEAPPSPGDGPTVTP